MAAKTKIGIVAFSFVPGDPLDEPNPCNIKLGEAVERIVGKIEMGLRIRKIDDKAWVWDEEEPSLQDWEMLDGDGIEPSTLQKVVIVAQLEIGYALEESDEEIVPDFIIKRHRLGPEEVAAQATEYFQANNITIVIPIAHPLLMTQCRQLLQTAGFEILDMSEFVGQIGFNPKSSQWWTRSQFQWFCHSLFQKFTDRRGQ